MESFKTNSHPTPVKTSHKFSSRQTRVWETRSSALRASASLPTCGATANQSATAARTRGSAVSMANLTQGSFRLFSTFSGET